VGHQPIDVGPTFALKFAPKHPPDGVREDVGEFQTWLLIGFEFEIF
jgi:hypothetical protein